ncbi:small nucleolar RNA-associated protein [Candida albicans]|uniref:U3 small nucleolar RNA-associated protein 10 n=1 Tax=Candida albicans TaxID=5476 RepID=A0A8H6BXB3_CANAX|nr:small nucleolar RNA-associated protein [Candida albicans]
MSSLASQLQSINEKTASVALDRKQRSKLHSRSLIFDPKQAATQDYEYIYEIATEGLEDLCELDSRFNKFKSTLFSETSVNLDRNLQTKDVISQLDKNIDAFLTLVGPYYGLTSSLKAVEWLVRRFHANIHNAELMILTALPYFQHPVFVKVLNVIPKQNLPQIFEWLVGYKDQLKTPPASSILKAFRNDFHFFNFYSKFLNDQIKNHTVYKEQLVFYLSNTVQLLASFSKNIEELNETHIPVVLETTALMLLPQQKSKYSSSINSDLKLTSYSIISVLSSIFPFSADILKSLTVSILEDKDALKGFTKPTLIVLSQLWKHFQGNLEVIEAFKNFKIGQHELDVLDELKNENYQLSTFVMLVFISTFPSNESYKLLPFIDLSNKTVFEIITKLVLQNSTTQEDSIRSNLTKIAQSLTKSDPKLFQTTLESENWKVDELELKLMSVLVESKNDEAEFDAGDEDNAVEDIEIVKTVDFSKLQSTAKSYFNTEYDEEFNLVLKELKSVLSASDAKLHVSVILTFLQKVFSTPEVALTFAFRVALTPAVPLSIRLSAIKSIRIKIKNAANGKTDFYLLIPLILLALFDNSKLIRSGFAQLLRLVIEIKTKLTTGAALFLEREIYGSVSDKKYPTPHDSLFLCSLLSEDNVKDTVLDPSRVINILFDSIFKAKNGKSKPGKYFRSFIFTHGRCAHCQFKRNVWIDQASIAGIAFFDNVEVSVVGLVGGVASNDKNSNTESEWLCRALENPSGNLQMTANNRVLETFDTFKPIESRLKIVNKLIDILINDDIVEFDPMATLQELNIDRNLFLQALTSVQIGDQIPEQGIAKRRRRSSNSTKQAMVRDEINNMASGHLKKLTFLLEILESSLRKKRNVAGPDLLKVLFKILTDLEYLGNDGNLPVLYAQETLASFKFDSNSIRADLIVNSIRASPSPQVQNRLLLVISELASLAPEVILHSVMPIFTFMGAHTVRQDDEFSSSALQQTVAKVIPALASNGLSSVNNEIEFLLASFATAFPHVPRHRRVKLFVSLTKTLGCAESMHLILFLMGQQYANNVHKNKNGDSQSVVEFVHGYMKSFSAEEQLAGIVAFTKLWNDIPLNQLEPGSEEFEVLNNRPVFGTTIATLGQSGLAVLRNDLLQFLDETLSSENKHELSSLKTKMALVLIDDEDSKVAKKESVLDKFRAITSFALASLDTFTNSHADIKLCSTLYSLLGNLLDLLPLNYFIDSIVASLDVDTLSDSLSIKVARNYAILASRKFETELNVAHCDQVVIESFGASGTEFASSDVSKVLIESLGIVTTDRGLLNEQPEVIIASINAITSIVNILGVKTLGLFPKVESAKLLQGSVLVLLSCYIKKIPAFMSTTLEAVLLTILSSDLIDNHIRSSVLDLIVDHMDLAQVLKSLCNATLFMRWLISAFEFRQYSEDNDNKFDNNTIHRLESSFHGCAIAFVMKLNDKSFRPLFANLVRWAVDGEGATLKTNEVSRLLAFFRFFNKLQDELKSIITSYFSYLLDPTSALLKRFSEGSLVATNLRRIILIGLTSSFKYDQDDYCTFVTDVSSDEYNETLVHELIKYISNANENSAATKIWSIRTLKTIFQKMGEQWLSYLPTLVPYIAELLEDDDEEVEMEVRRGLVRVIENVLGEPLDRYLS